MAEAEEEISFDSPFPIRHTVLTRPSLRLARNRLMLSA
jgi:hypothetical protein